LTFEARVTQGRWDLHAYINSSINTKVYKSHATYIASNSDKTIWQETTWYFRFPSDEDCFLEFSVVPVPSAAVMYDFDDEGDKFLRKDSLEMSKNGRLQIRNIVLMESVTAS
jgi:hypothetical protein